MVDVLLPLWTEIEIDDALEMLGPGDSFKHKDVRSFAVRQISRADDEVGVCRKSRAKARVFRVGRYGLFQGVHSVTWVVIF